MKNKLTVSIIAVQTLFLVALLVYFLIPKGDFSLEGGQTGPVGTQYWIKSTRDGTTLGYFSVDVSGRPSLVNFQNKNDQLISCALDKEVISIAVKDEKLNFQTSLWLNPLDNRKVIFHKDSLDGKTLPFFVSFQDRPKILDAEEVKKFGNSFTPEGPAGQ